ncbi:hypothetical protein SOVF_062090 [Spinacia oleracea]|nr:hypothetical protein SOVF_062090 [Spinacia oleracea]
MLLQYWKKTARIRTKKMRCSGSLCNNTKVMQRPDSTSPELLQRKSRGGTSSTTTTTTSAASTSTTSSSSLEGSNRSIKSPVLSELSNNTNTNNNGVLLKSSSSNCSNYIKGMPFIRLSGCYECRMVVDPVLAFTRDPFIVLKFS